MEKKKHFERPTMQRPPSMFNLTILTVIIGVVAGFGGYFLARQVWPVSDIDYFNLLDNRKEIKIDLEQPLTNLADQHQKSVAGVYKKVQTLSAVGQPLFSEDDFLGSAVVVTSDGWMMTTDQVLKNTAASVVLGDRIYEITDISEDDFSGAVFFKIDSNALQPVDFQLTDDVKVGERLFTNIDLAKSYYHSFYTNFLTNTHYIAEQYLSSDEIDYYLQIDNQLPDVNLLAAPYFNISGDLLGIVYDYNDQIVLLPAEYLQQATKHLLEGTTRLSLAIRYVDMENNSGFMRKGNLVYHPSLRAIGPDSPALEAGLQVGDQIVAINNDVVSADKTLTSILQNYRPGDSVIIKILRNDVEQDIVVKL